ncbi:hypothetical protein Pfo_013662 [Paulownia fortunei]|nr:hypothetical protein Pfo_013662 [Paulownia fortunei]
MIRFSWGGFDKLELEGGVTRQVLLLGYSHGFRVWELKSSSEALSATVIAQFRHIKVPFVVVLDPSGTLLVTASVQGLNINVFRVMPRLSGGSSGAAPDIVFSSDSQWIMISSSRGTSHLFAVSPGRGGGNACHSARNGGSSSVAKHEVRDNINGWGEEPDACRSARNGGSSSVAKHEVHGSPISGLHVLTQQSICASGPFCYKQNKERT